MRLALTDSRLLRLRQLDPAWAGEPRSVTGVDSGWLQREWGACVICLDGEFWLEFLDEARALEFVLRHG